MFDQNKFYLGKLCKRGHEYQNTGMSLRYKNSSDYGCVQCSRNRHKEHYKNNSPRILSDRTKESKVRNNLWQKFHITLEQYQEMYNSQNGLCAICNKPETRIDHRSKKISALAVDHDHKTGEVRGLLCHKCNTGLGSFDDSIFKLLKAVWYTIINHFKVFK